MNTDAQFDYILVGGGLQSGLLCLALKHHQPHARVLLLERNASLGGEHTWSFHPGDIPDSCRRWIAPLFKYSWPRYHVRLDGFRRSVELDYASIPSTHFAEIVEPLFESKQSFAVCGSRSEAEVSSVFQAPSLQSTHWEYGPKYDSRSDQNTHCQTTWSLKKETEVIHIDSHRIVTSSGESMVGRLVIDCRGPTPNRQIFSGCGYQKFFGFEIELEHDWPWEAPVVMDSAVDQSDGFRFIYTLPFTPRRVLVEDTRFSDTSNLSREDCLETVRAYLRTLGIDDFRIVREENGILPMPFSGENRPAARTPLAGGYAGGWFHAATGYSFPMAVAFAEAVATVQPEAASASVAALAERHVWRSAYARFLNRLLFRLVVPRKRGQIFKRFYRVLREPSIERFYSHRFGAWDATRIVVGIPPTWIGLRPWRFVRSFFGGDV